MHMGGFLDLESPPSSKTKSNKGNQQPKWRSTSSAQRKPKRISTSDEKRKPKWGVTPGLCGTGLKMITETFGN